MQCLSGRGRGGDEKVLGRTNTYVQQCNLTLRGKFSCTFRPNGPTFGMEEGEIRQNSPHNNNHQVVSSPDSS